MTDNLRETLISTAASLAAAISLLERGGKSAKKAAPSDKMFDMMLEDYRESLNEARAALAVAPALQPAPTAQEAVQALDWVDLGDSKSFRALLPIIGSVRVEPYGCCGWWEVLWSMPGQCDKLIPDVFDNPDDAKAAAQADYERRILSQITTRPASEIEVENARLKAALEKCLNYIENTENELGIKLECGKAARAALAVAPAPQPAPNPLKQARHHNQKGLHDAQT